MTINFTRLYSINFTLSITRSGSPGRSGRSGVPSRFYCLCLWLRVASYEFHLTSYEFKFTSYKFKTMSYKLKSRSYEFKLKAQVQELRVHTYELRVHKHDLEN